MPRRISEELTQKETIRPQLESAGEYLYAYSKAKVGEDSLLTNPEFKFLQISHLQTAETYEPPLAIFGAVAAEMRFTYKEVSGIVNFINKLVVSNSQDANHVQPRT